jgi:hypothetical protein
MPIKLKSPLLTKMADFRDALNDPETAINDPRADKTYQNPFAEKGTEPKQAEANPDPVAIQKETPVAGFTEGKFGPFACKHCHFFSTTGHCNNPKMLDDPKVKKEDVEGKKVAVVDADDCCNFFLKASLGEKQAFGPKLTPEERLMVPEWEKQNRENPYLGPEKDFIIEGNASDGYKVTCRHCGAKAKELSAVAMAHHMKSTHPSEAHSRRKNGDAIGEERLRNNMEQDQIWDDEEEAHQSFMDDDEMKGIAADAHLEMDTLWQQYKKEYCDAYHASKFGSKSAKVHPPEPDIKDAEFFKESEEGEIESKAAGSVSYGTNTPEKLPVKPTSNATPAPMGEEVAPPDPQVQPQQPVKNQPEVVYAQPPTAGQKQQMRNTADKKPIAAVFTVEHLRVGHPVDPNAIKVAVEKALGSKYFVVDMHTSAVQMHTTPTSLPPRDDMRTHLDEEVAKEIKEDTHPEKVAARKCQRCGDYLQMSEGSVCDECQEATGGEVTDVGTLYGKPLGQNTPPSNGLIEGLINDVDNKMPQVELTCKCGFKTGEHASYALAEGTLKRHYRLTHKGETFGEAQPLELTDKDKDYMKELRIKASKSCPNCHAKSASADAAHSEEGLIECIACGAFYSI